MVFRERGGAFFPKNPSSRTPSAPSANRDQRYFTHLKLQRYQVLTEIYPSPSSYRATSKPSNPRQLVENSPQALLIPRQTTDSIWSNTTKYPQRLIILSPPNRDGLIRDELLQGREDRYYPPMLRQ